MATCKFRGRCRWRPRASILNAHVLLIIREDDKPKTASHVDQVVSVEIPDPVSEPALYNLVDTHMVHGPCGALNLSCPCMKDGTCTKKRARDSRAAMRPE